MTKFLISLLLLTTVCYGQATLIQKPDNDTDSNWKKLDRANYSVQYPSDWDLDESGQMGTSFVLFSSLESDKDQFKENVNLLIQDLSGYNLDLTKYTELSLKQIKTLIPNSTLPESKRIKTKSEEYQRLIYTGDQSKFHLKFEQYYWIKNDKAYVLTLTCEQNKFSKYKNTGEKILNSFRLK